MEDPAAPKPRGSSPKSPTEGPSQDRVVIDPSKGGAVAPKTESKSKALEVQAGTWVWDGLVKLLEVDLFSAAWEVRHGAAMALREVLKLQGKYGGMKGASTWCCAMETYGVNVLAISQPTFLGTRIWSHTRSGAMTSP